MDNMTKEHKDLVELLDNLMKYLEKIVEILMNVFSALGGFGGKEANATASDAAPATGTDG